METVKIILLCAGWLIVGMGIGVLICKWKTTDGWELVDEEEVSEEAIHYATELGTKVELPVLFGGRPIDLDNK